MNSYQIYVAFVIITSCVLSGNAKAVSEPVRLASSIDTASSLGDASNLSRTSDTLSNLDSLQQQPAGLNVSTYQPAAVEGFEKIARLDIKKLCESFPLNSRCQGTATEPKIEVNPRPSSETEIKAEDKETTEERKAAVSGFAVVPVIGTLGAGLQLHKSVTPHFNARIGGNYFEYRMNRTYDGNRYDATIKLQNAMLAGDYYPWKRSGFHLSLGVAYNGNDINGLAKSVGGTTTNNGETYAASDVGDIRAKISYPIPVAPYIGIGWGNPVALHKRLGFYINAGILITGTPNATLTAMPDPTLPQDTQDRIVSDVKAQERSLQNSLNYLPVYPVITAGFSLQF